MAELTPAQEARRRKLELRLHLGSEALLTGAELCEIFCIREAELLAWTKRLPVHVVAGKQHFRYGDVVKASRVPDPTATSRDDESPPRGATTQGRLKRATLEPVKKRTG